MGKIVVVTDSVATVPEDIQKKYMVNILLVLIVIIQKFAQYVGQQISLLNL